MRDTSKLLSALFDDFNHLNEQVDCNTDELAKNTSNVGNLISADNLKKSRASVMMEGWHEKKRANSFFDKVFGKLKGMPEISKAE